MAGKAIIIDNFQKGIAQSPHLGFADMRNMDISSKIGVCKPQFAMSKTSASVITSTFEISSIVFDEENGIFYATTSAGVLYTSSNSGVTWTALSTTNYTAYSRTELVIWKDYLLAIGDNSDVPTIQFYGPLKGLVYAGTFAFVDSDPDTITDGANGFVTEGLKANAKLVVTDSVSSNGTYTIDTVVAGTLTLIGGDTLPAGAAEAATLTTSAIWQTVTITGQSSNSNEQISALIAIDNVVYYGHGRFINSLLEKDGQVFVPETSASYTATSNALDLPNNIKVKVIGELSTNLMIGTTTAVSGVSPTPFANIYPWDRTSPQYNLPIRIGDFSVRAMVTVGRKMYFFTGDKGQLWITNGVDVQQVGELPPHLFDFDSKPGNSVVIQKNTMQVKDDKILFGVGNIDDFDAYPVGMWSYNMKTDAWTFENELSITSSLTPIIGSIYVQSGGKTLVGWAASGNSAGIDISSTSTVEGSYGAFGISKFYHVGTKYEPRAIEKLDVLLSKRLAANDAVRISYRENESDSFTVLKNFDTDGQYSFNKMTPLNLQMIQIKFEITTAGTSIPEIREIRLV